MNALGARGTGAFPQCRQERLVTSSAECMAFWQSERQPPRLEQRLPLCLRCGAQGTVRKNITC